MARFHEAIARALDDPQLPKHASIIEQFQREHPDVAIDQITAALSVLLHGEEPLLLTEELRQPTFADQRPSNEPFRDRRDSRPDDRRPSGPRRDRGMDTYRIEVGHAHQVKPGNIVGAIANEAGLGNGTIGRIEIFDDYSLVDLPEGMPKEIFKALERTVIFGQPLNISRLNGPNPDKPAFVDKAKAPTADSTPAEPAVKKAKRKKPKREKVAAG